MNRLFLIAFFFLVSYGGFSQDTIYVKDGRVLLCKIANIDSSKINFTIKHNDKNIKTSIDRIEVTRYKIQPATLISGNASKPNTNNIYPNTDTIILSENGKVIIKNGRLLSYDELIDTLKSNITTYKLALNAKKNAKTNFYFSCAGGYCIGYGIGYSIGTAIMGKTIDWAMFGIFEGLGIGLIYIGKPFNHKAVSLTRKAIMEYNRNKRTTSTNYYFKPELELHFHGNNIGIALEF